MSGAVLACGGILAAACGTDNGTTPVPSVEAGRDTGSSGGDSGNVDNDSGQDLDAATNADCANAPRLRDLSKGFYCSFFFRDGGAGDGGDAGLSPTSCTNDETCCNPPDNSDGTHNAAFCATGKPVSADEAFCQAQAGAYGSAWPTGGKYPGTVWACGDGRNCAANEVCCMFTQPDAGTNTVNVGKSTDKSVPAACNALQAYKQGGTICRAAATGCTAGSEIPLCASDADCKTGKCTPFEAFYKRNLGYCR